MPTFIGILGKADSQLGQFQLGAVGGEPIIGNDTGSLADTGSVVSIRLLLGNVAGRALPGHVGSPVELAGSQEASILVDGVKAVALAAAGKSAAIAILGVAAAWNISARGAVQLGVSGGNSTAPALPGSPATSIARAGGNDSNRVPPGSSSTPLVLFGNS